MLGSSCPGALPALPVSCHYIEKAWVLHGQQSISFNSITEDSPRTGLLIINSSSLTANFPCHHFNITDGSPSCRLLMSADALSYVQSAYTTIKLSLFHALRNQGSSGQPLQPECPQEQPLLFFLKACSRMNKNSMSTVQLKCLSICSTPPKNYASHIYYASHI